MLKGKVKKIIICCIMCFTMVLTNIQPILASEMESNNIKQNYAVKVAYIQDVDAKGSNLKNDVNDGKLKVVSDCEVIVNKSDNNAIAANITINNINFDILGTPIARTESGKTVFFNGTSSKNEYEIVNFAYVLDTSVTNMYFKNTKDQEFPSLNTILKIYIKDISSSTSTALQ